MANTQHVEYDRYGGTEVAREIAYVVSTFRLLRLGLAFSARRRVSVLLRPPCAYLHHTPESYLALSAQLTLHIVIELSE